MSASDNFSKRIQAHPHIASLPISNGSDIATYAVADQLLICESVWTEIREYLAIETQAYNVITTLLTGLTPVAGAEDVMIVHVDRFPNRDVFDLVKRLRQSLGLEDDEAGKVSPNHVLIPAPESHGCPYGAPSPVAHAPGLDPMAAPFASVTIIDSGYQWNHTWGDNPLATYGEIDVEEQDFVGAGGWQAGIPDGLDVDGDGKLDALAGHANFIAGVIAQLFTGARMTIRNHNGGFAPDSDDFPTEAAVARSLGLSGAADVIDCGFAFAVYDGGVSCAWDTAMKQLGPDPIVVAPAGNNESAIARYPAALASSFPNVVGVGSIDRFNAGGTPQRTEFSNVGPWVKCSARGRNVVSTFLKVDMPVEDDDAAEPKARNFANAWAKWNGTSFATPKIVALIAREVANGNSTVDALNNVLNEGTPDPDKEVGKALDV